MQKVNVLLPMKGNSERVPNKNLKSFNGEPLYHAVIHALNTCPLIDSIYINTDSIEIKKDAINNFENVVIIDRPAQIKGDHVSMNKIIKYDLNQIEGSHFLQTHSTNPLLKTQTIVDAILFYFENINKFDSLFSVTKWKTRLYWKDGKPINHNPADLIRTQDLTPVFEENSNFYIFSKESFESADDKRIGTNPYMYPVNKFEALDIDELEDFTMAEILYKKFELN